MKKIILVLVLFIGIKVVYGQEQVSNENSATNQTINKPEPLGESSDTMPTPVGGTDSLYFFIARNIHYPVKAMVEKAEGRVYVKFIVTEEGKLEDVKVLKGVAPSLDEEAVRIIKLSEAKLGWIPGTSQGRNVRVGMAIPITFRIGNSVLPGNNVDERNEHEVSDKILGASTERKEEEKVDVQPVPKGGYKALNAALDKKLKHPSDDYEGRVFVQYTITEEGKVEEIEILHGKIASESMRKNIEEAIRWTETKPGWIPGSYQGKAVKVRVVQPLVYKKNEVKCIPVERHTLLRSSY